MPKPLPSHDDLRRILAADERIVFAYLYGSYVKNPGLAGDLDLAVYADEGADPFVLAADLKIALSRATGVSVDFFDVRVIDRLVEDGDLFGLVFLRGLFESGVLLLDRDRDRRGGFLEDYGMKYRECEGLIAELLA